MVELVTFVYFFRWGFFKMDWRVGLIVRFIIVILGLWGFF